MFWIDSNSVPLLVYSQHSPEHFLEVKLESYNTRFFHIKEDFAFTEVSFVYTDSRIVDVELLSLWLSSFDLDHWLWLTEQK